MKIGTRVSYNNAKGVVLGQRSDSNSCIVLFDNVNSNTHNGRSCTDLSTDIKDNWHPFYNRILYVASFNLTKLRDKDMITIKGKRYSEDTIHEALKHYLQLNFN